MMNFSVLALLQSVVGEAHVHVDTDSLEANSTATYPTVEEVVAVVYPQNTAEIQAIVRLANEHQFALYTVSKGKNWGYGSRVPVKDGAVLLNLSRMNRIIDFDEKMGHVTVEPGVSPKQLFEFLRAKKSNLLVSIGGSSPELSLIGNTVERGIGVGQCGDRFSNATDYEVILPDGTLLQTGYERYPNAKSAKVFQRAPGPYVEGLFTQSNLGIVTKVTMWLMPCPNYAKMFFFTTNDQAKFAQLQEQFREMSMSGLVKPSTSFYNDFRVLTFFMQYDRGLDDKQLTNDELANLLIDSIQLKPRIGKWNGDILIRGENKEQVDKEFELIQARIGHLIDDYVVTEGSREELHTILDTAVQHPDHLLTDMPPIERFLFIKYLGIPTGMGLKQAYWRKEPGRYDFMDPDRDRCGIVWLAPVLPFTGEDVTTCTALILEKVENYGLQTGISLINFEERSIYVFASILWDRDRPEEEERAMSCYRELIRLLKEAGYYSYRHSTLLMQKNQENELPYEEFLTKLKNTLDPNNVLSPGRYKIGI